MFNPKYRITNKILNQLSEIAAIRAVVSKTTLLPEREIFLKKAAIIKMAHTSTSIEGNQLREHQVSQVASGKTILADENQITEVKNYLKALNEIDHLSSTKKNFDASDIKDLHRIVINGLVEKEKAGNWRLIPVYIVNILSTGDEEIAYTPPKAMEVPSLINELLDWIEKNKEIHPIIRMGILHYQFETIHPFTDGNGRTGRLLSLLHLYQSGWDFKKILVLEDHYNRNRKAYYEALQTGTTYKSRASADLTDWLEYFIEGFLEESKKLKDQIGNLSLIANINPSRKNLNKDELQIIDFLITMNQITSSDVVDILGIPKRTAQLKLKTLEDLKIIEKIGLGPSTYYVIAKLG